MKYLFLLVANLRRKKLRTIVTIFSIATAFFLYTVLIAIRFGFEGGVEMAGANRLLMIHKTAIINPLPISYLPKIKETKGVKAVTHSSWFGGTYKDPKNFFPRVAVVPEEYLAMYPELNLSDAEKTAWFAERTGAILGRDTANRYEIKVGDTLPIMPDIWQKKGGGAWEFKIVGIYDSDKPGTDLTQMFFNYEYFDKARARGEGLVGWYTVEIEDPAQATDVAQRLDKLFANSSDETKTGTEQAVAQSFANQVGDIASIVNYVLLATFFTILMIAGTTMSQAVRERTGELGVLKAIGFGNVTVLLLVVGEAMVITLLGAGLGFALALWMLPVLDKVIGNYVPVSHLPPKDLIIGAIVAAGLGIVTGIIPGVAAMRLRIVDALRRG